MAYPKSQNISKTSMLKVCFAAFSVFDRDGDGCITLEELIPGVFYVGLASGTSFLAHHSVDILFSSLRLLGRS